METWISALHTKVKVNFTSTYRKYSSFLMLIVKSNQRNFPGQSELINCAVFCVFQVAFIPTKHQLVLILLFQKHHLLCNEHGSVVQLAHKQSLNDIKAPPNFVQTGMSTLYVSTLFISFLHKRTFLPNTRITHGLYSYNGGPSIQIRDVLNWVETILPHSYNTQLSILRLAENISNSLLRSNTNPILISSNHHSRNSSPLS